MIALASFLLRVVTHWSWGWPVGIQFSTEYYEEPQPAKTRDLGFVEFLPNTVLLTLTNTGYIVLTKNLITSLEMLGMGKYLTVASFEARATKSLKEMKEFSGRVHELDQRKASPLATFETPDFKENAGRRKLIAIKWYLSRGHNVFYIDSDIVVLRDFRPVLPKQDLDTYDAILQDGRGSDRPTPNWFEPCTGFMYLRASPTTLNCTDLEKHKLLWDRTRDDQSYLVKEFLPYWNIKQLPKAQFVTGWWVNNVIKDRRSMRRRMYQNGNKTLYIVHMNYMKGGVTKARHHWKFGTFFYEGPGVAELLDLENYKE